MEIKKIKYLKNNKSLLIFRMWSANFLSWARLVLHLERSCTQLKKFSFLFDVTPGVHVTHFYGTVSVSDLEPEPDPDPPDPHIFGPRGSGSISQRYGSGSFYHPSIIKQIVRKTLIPTVLWILLDFYLWCKFSVGVLLTKLAGTDPNPDPLVRGMDSRIRIRIHTKMSCVRNTGYCTL
jgi:hypothetical protein